MQTFSAKFAALSSCIVRQIAWSIKTTVLTKLIHQTHFQMTSRLLWQNNTTSYSTEASCLKLQLCQPQLITQFNSVPRSYATTWYNSLVTRITLSTATTLSSAKVTKWRSPHLLVVTKAKRLFPDPSCWISFQIKPLSPTLKWSNAWIGNSGTTVSQKMHFKQKIEHIVYRWAKQPVYAINVVNKLSNYSRRKGVQSRDQNANEVATGLKLDQSA